MWRLLLGTMGVKSIVQGLNAAATAGFEPRTVWSEVRRRNRLATSLLRYKKSHFWQKIKRELSHLTAQMLFSSAWNRGREREREREREGEERGGREREREREWGRGRGRGRERERRERERAGEREREREGGGGGEREREREIERERERESFLCSCTVFSASRKIPIVCPFTSH